jgi:hypothetical protein
VFAFLFGQSKKNDRKLDERKGTKKEYRREREREKNCIVEKRK